MAASPGRIAGTPLCVDHFGGAATGGEQIYFLTHAHTDHTSGLSAAWSRGVIYCSSVTKQLLRLQHGAALDRRVRALSLDHAHTIAERGGERDASFSVRLLCANHCPGAVMLHFSSARWGSILHTGDFRFYAPAFASSELANLVGRVDRLYFDATFFGERFLFPPQPDAVDHAVRLVEDVQRQHAERERQRRPPAAKLQRGGLSAREQARTRGPPTPLAATPAALDYRVYISAESLGTESLLAAVCLAMREPLYVAPAFAARAAQLRLLAGIDEDGVADSSKGGAHYVHVVTDAHDAARTHLHLAPATSFDAFAHMIRGQREREWRDYRLAQELRGEPWPANDRPPLTLFLKPSTQWFVHHTRSPDRGAALPMSAVDRGDVTHVLYSMHSDVREICDFIRFLDPRAVCPNNVPSLFDAEAAEGEAAREREEQQQQQQQQLSSAANYGTHRRLDCADLTAGLAKPLVRLHASSPPVLALVRRVLASHMRGRRVPLVVDRDCVPPRHDLRLPSARLTYDDLWSSDSPPVDSARPLLTVALPSRPAVPPGSAPVAHEAAPASSACGASRPATPLAVVIEPPLSLTPNLSDMSVTPDASEATARSSGTKRPFAEVSPDGDAWVPHSPPDPSLIARAPVADEATQPTPHSPPYAWPSSARCVAAPSTGSDNALLQSARPRVAMRGAAPATIHVVCAVPVAVDALHIVRPTSPPVSMVSPRLSPRTGAACASLACGALGCIVDVDMRRRQCNADGGRRRITLLTGDVPWVDERREHARAAQLEPPALYAYLLVDDEPIVRRICTSDRRLMQRWVSGMLSRRSPHVAYYLRFSSSQASPALRLLAIGSYRLREDGPRTSMLSPTPLQL